VRRIALAVLLAPLLGASDCASSDDTACEPTDGTGDVGITGADLANDYGISDPGEIDGDTCVAICEDYNSGLTAITLCEVTEEKADGGARIHCEGTYACG
jgi:hypothetical protein